MQSISACCSTKRDSPFSPVMARFLSAICRARAAATRQSVHASKEIFKSARKR
jgi:hypothetical protein